MDTGNGSAFGESLQQVRDKVQRDNVNELPAERFGAGVVPEVSFRQISDAGKKGNKTLGILTISNDNKEVNAATLKFTITPKPLHLQFTRVH